MKHDAIVVGGGFAGLAAATYLARARRSVRVLDTGKPRNRFADEAHGFLGHDGSDPRLILASARRQLLAYPTAEILEMGAMTAKAVDGGFRVRLSSGEEVEASKLILSFGLRDELPAIPGLVQRWGKTVLHCPYCHGIEFSDQRLGVLYRVPMSVHQACLIAEWGPTTLFLNGASLSDEDRATLARHGVAVELAPVVGLLGERSGLSAIALKDGRERELAALYVAPRSCLASDLAEQLGAEIEEGLLGEMIRTDADKMTRVPGLYAAGDIARMPHSVSWSVADGVTAGTSAHRALVFG